MKSQEILANTARLGPVHLRVVDIPAALPVWREVVGLSTLTREGGIAELGVDGKTLIVLHSGATTVLPSKSRDLFHIAIHVTTRKELARVAARLRVSGLRHMHTCPRCKRTGCWTSSIPRGTACGWCSQATDVTAVGLNQGGQWQ